MGGDFFCVRAYKQTTAYALPRADELSDCDCYFIQASSDNLCCRSCAKSYNKGYHYVRLIALTLSLIRFITTQQRVST
jgi:hypothetical protein